MNIEWGRRRFPTAPPPATPPTRMATLPSERRTNGTVPGKPAGFDHRGGSLTADGAEGHGFVFRGGRIGFLFFVFCFWLGWGPVTPPPQRNPPPPQTKKPQTTNHQPQTTNHSRTRNHGWRLNSPHETRKTNGLQGSQVRENAVCVRQRLGRHPLIHLRRQIVIRLVSR